MLANGMIWIVKSKCQWIAEDRRGLVKGDTMLF